VKNKKNQEPPKRPKSTSREVDKSITTKSSYKDHIQREKPLTGASKKLITARLTENH
jgi:hypothetical protein